VGVGKQGEGGWHGREGRRSPKEEAEGRGSSSASTEGEGCAAGSKGEGPRAGHSDGSGLIFRTHSGLDQDSPRTHIQDWLRTCIQDLIRT